MIFGSWVYNSEELRLDYFENMRSVDLNDYVPSGTWDLIDVPATIQYYNDTSTNKTKMHMVYKIKMRRKSLFYTVNVIIPTFLISVLSVCVFYLPTDDGEKITLSLSVLFSLIVFFLLIAKMIPPTSVVVPLISKYLLFTFIMNILSVLNTCFVIRLYYRNLKMEKIGPWANFIFFKAIPVLLFMKKKKIDINKSKFIFGANLLPKSCMLGNYEKETDLKHNSFIYYQKNRRYSPLVSTRKVKHSHNQFNKNCDDPKYYSFHDINGYSNDIDKINYKNNSNLYNLNILNNSPVLKPKISAKSGTNINFDNQNAGLSNRFYTKKVNKNLYKNKELLSSDQKNNYIWNLNKKTNFITFETIDPTENLKKACDSIGYISDMLREKAELEQVNIIITFIFT
jgi:hypothetical protein